MTGIQWAVLTAYARVFPPDSETRQVIEEATGQHAPTPSGQRVALSVAEASGMTRRGRITEFGRDAARRYLPHLTAAKGPA